MTARNFLAALGLAATVLGAGATALAQNAGPTGLEALSPEDAVTARQELKGRVALMRGLIEEAVARGDEDAWFDAADDLATIAAIVEAFPHLFPAASSPAALSAAGSDASTSASPTIWEDFPAFVAMARDVSSAALMASQAEDFTEMAAASETVWAGCTACHDAYLFYDPLAGMEGMESDEIDSPFF